MTIHSAKGLEFPYVYIVGLEENLFPNLMSMQSRADLEEERRLFYVALTRAEKRAALSYAVSRYRYGTLQSAEPSRFIQEVDPKYLQLPGREAAPAFGSTRSFAERNGFAAPARPAQATGPHRTFAPRERPAT